MLSQIHSGYVHLGFDTRLAAEGGDHILGRLAPTWVGPATTHFNLSLGPTPTAAPESLERTPGTVLLLPLHAGGTKPHGDRNTSVVPAARAIAATRTRLLELGRDPAL